MQISEQIIEVLDYLCEKLGVTIDWTSANVLPYLNTLCEKYIRYEIATSVVWLIVGIIGVAIFAVFCRNAVRKFNKAEYSCDQDEYFKMIVLFVILMLPFAIVTMEQILDIVECCTIPEKVIFDYIQTAVSKKQMIG